MLEEGIGFMIDRPDAARLLRAMANTLTNQVLPATAGGAQHSARVVANLCRILERQVRLGEDAAEATRRDLGDLLGRDGTLPELVAALDDRLRQPARGGPDKPESSAEAAFESRAHASLLADVERRLAIDRPGYDT